MVRPPPVASHRNSDRRLNMGAVAMTPLILFLIGSYRWRTGWLWLRSVPVPWFVVVPPPLRWLRRQLEGMSLLPDGDTVEAL